MRTGYCENGIYHYLCNAIGKQNDCKTKDGRVAQLDRATAF